MNIRHVKPEEAEAWLVMRRALWPETNEDRHLKEMAKIIADRDQYAAFVCENEKNALVGFAETSLRECAEGCTSSPVGYLEGWFVTGHARGQGIGSKLLAASEDWARANNCTEMASDTDIKDKATKAIHRKLGYQIAGMVVAFRKNLKAP